MYLYAASFSSFSRLDGGQQLGRDKFKDCKSHCPDGVARREPPLRNNKGEGKKIGEEQVPLSPGTFWNVCWPAWDTVLSRSSPADSPISCNRTQKRRPTGPRAAANEIQTQINFHQENCKKNHCDRTIIGSSLSQETLKKEKARTKEIHWTVTHDTRLTATR